MKQFLLLASLAAMMGQANLASAQDSAPHKTAPTGDIDNNWSQGLSQHDTKLVNRVTLGKSDEDRYMVHTAIVRNREASRDIFKGEKLTDKKVLANVRVRMTTDESKRWATVRGHLSARDLHNLITVLRDDLATKH
jgi:hypothetical protein